MLNDRPTIFCFEVSGLLSSFGFVSIIPHTTMLNAHPTIFRFGVLGLFSSFGFVSNISHTHTTVLNAHPTILYFRVLGFLSSFSFVWIDPSRCTKKKLSFSILILISNFLRQMRYRWNCHHSYIVNIVFLNNLVQKQTFFIFCIFVFIRYKGSPLGRVSFDRLYKSQRHGTTFLTACVTADLNFEGGWPRMQVECAPTETQPSGEPLIIKNKDENAKYKKSLFLH